MSTTTAARSTTPGSRPTAAPPQVRLLGSGPRRWRWLGLGLAIMTAGALAGVVAVDRINERQAVLVAGGDLAAGHVLTAADLEVARISGTEDVSVIPEGHLEDAVGSTLTVPVPEGGVLPESALGPDSDYPGEGSAIVGAVLAPGRFPPSLQHGATVSVVVVDDSASSVSGGGNDGDDESTNLPDSSGVTAYAARVESVANTETEGSISVELVVDAEVAAQVSAAAATERATVVQVQAGGRS